MLESGHFLVTDIWYYITTFSIFAFDITNFKFGILLFFEFNSFHILLGFNSSLPQLAWD
jgi:hypothetical protein